MIGREYIDYGAASVAAETETLVTRRIEQCPNQKQLGRSRLDTLVKELAFPEQVHRVLLYGAPGTGKSSWAGTQFAHVERIALHPQQPQEDLIGSLLLTSGAPVELRDRIAKAKLDQQQRLLLEVHLASGGANTVWQDGPAVRAMRRGCALVLDEIDQHSPELRCALHAILDDKAIAGITLPTGERVEPAAGFAVIATTNAQPSALPEALLDRFDVKLLANEPRQRS